MAQKLPYRVTKPGSRVTSRDANRDRLQPAVEAVTNAEGLLSITHAAKLYGVSKKTLYHRINGRRDQLSFGVELGVNLNSGFLERHPALQSKYNRTLDQERYPAEDPEIIQQWFDLYRSIKAEYGILDEDNYNMDENGYMLGVGGSSKVVSQNTRNRLL